MGLEPTTTGITILDSTNWATTTIETEQTVVKTSGLPDRNRTCNPQLRRLVLYPVELRADALQEQLLKTRPKTGRRGEIRTPDILLPKQARYQATLHAEGQKYSANKAFGQFEYAKIVLYFK